MESINQNDIQYEIIQSETALNQPLDQGDYVVEYRKILDIDYWLRASESKANLYGTLNSIITKIVIIFVILLIGFSVIFYKTISNAFNNIISELEKKIKKLNENKKLLENLTDQVPGALYQFQTKWEEIKRHSEYGYKIAKSSEEFAAVAEDILAHHEHWDGSGYPTELKGEIIPYLARVISIIDAYDVMTHDRPYSKAISKEEALAEIKRCAGSQFDPELVEVFVEMMEGN